MFVVLLPLVAGHGKVYSPTPRSGHKYDDPAQSTKRCQGIKGSNSGQKFKGGDTVDMLYAFNNNHGGHIEATVACLDGGITEEKAAWVPVNRHTSEKTKKDFNKDFPSYQFLFVDNKGDLECKNKEYLVKNDLLNIKADAPAIAKAIKKKHEWSHSYTESKWVMPGSINGKKTCKKAVLEMAWLATSTAFMTELSSAFEPAQCERPKLKDVANRDGMQQWRNCIDFELMEGVEAPKPPEPTKAPKPEPTKAPKPEPTKAPKPDPTNAPKPEPTKAPKPEPTKAPKPEPTKAPKPEPTEAPQPEPTEAPKPEPTKPGGGDGGFLGIGSLFGYLGDMLAETLGAISGGFGGIIDLIGGGGGGFFDEGEFIPDGSSSDEPTDESDSSDEPTDESDSSDEPTDESDSKEGSEKSYLVEVAATNASKNIGSDAEIDTKTALGAILTPPELMSGNQAFGIGMFVLLFL